MAVFDPQKNESPHTAGIVLTLSRWGNRVQRWLRKLADDFNVFEMFERVTGRSSNAARRLKVRSALNPMLWLCAIGSPVLFASAWLLAGIPHLAIMLAYVGMLPIVVTCLGFAYFALFRPSNLQSEEYQIRHEALELIREKGAPFEVIPSSLDAITNPYFPPLPEVGDDR